MLVEQDNCVYSTVRGSDVSRDGMFLELNRAGKSVAEVFFDDNTRKFTVSLFADNLPLSVLEKFFEEAKVDLPPKQ
jgi:hypothetical protein